jgi:hypothetical protein
MASRRQKIGAIVAVIIMASAGLTSWIYFSKSTTPPTLAETLVLKPSDLGGDWHLKDSLPADAISNKTLSFYGNELANGSLVLFSRVDVFNSSSDCNATYLWLKSYFNDSLITDVQLGEKAFRMVAFDQVLVVFVKNNIIGQVETDRVPIDIYHTQPFAWQNGTAMTFASILLGRNDAIPR